MKTIMLSLLLLAAGSTVCLAQCDKKVSLSSSKTEHLDGNGAVQETIDEKTTAVEYNATDVKVFITNDNGDQKLTGKIKSNVCNWTTPYKEGKSVITTALSDGNGNDKDFTITIEGKGGKLTLIAESQQMPDRKIRLPLENFGEAK